jgi:hypothetical protein
LRHLALDSQWCISTQLSTIASVARRPSKLAGAPTITHSAVAA